VPLLEALLDRRLDARELTPVEEAPHRPMHSQELGFPLFAALAITAVVVQYTVWMVAVTLTLALLARLTRPPAR
jgi:multisubunit Na+/H+ antiporter MnhC subunit